MSSPRAGLMAPLSVSSVASLELGEQLFEWMVKVGGFLAGEVRTAGSHQAGWQRPGEAQGRVASGLRWLKLLVGHSCLWRPGR